MAVRTYREIGVKERKGGRGWEERERKKKRSIKEETQEG